MNKNPIFVEYYSHEGCDCFKVNNPYTAYAEDKIVLCKVESGIMEAKRIAARLLTKHLMDALSLDIIPPSEY